MKELVVVLVIAAATFRLARPLALKFSAQADFSRRRNVWFALTIIAFLSPNFWVFALFAVPIYAWTGRKDSNPIAAYLLLMHVVPPVPVDIPTIGISQLFTLDNYRLLSFCILLPTALRARRSKDRPSTSSSRRSDLLLLGYGAVQVALFIPPDLPGHIILQDSFTNALRRGFLFFIDVLLLYYAVSRSCADRVKIVDATATFCVASGIMALLATFECIKTWLMYSAMALRWNPEDANYRMAWLFRGDSWLRAQASAGHPLALSIMLAIAFGFWLYLRTHETTLRARLSAGIVFWLGMIAAFSRGPWIGAVLIYLAYSALKPRAISRIFKAAFMIAVALGLLSLSPLGDRIMNSLPFAGRQPDSSLLYRERLADRSLELIQAHPLFGDQLAIQKMEDLRQGQGVIDVVNTYVGLALFNGLIGLALFVGFMLNASMGVFRVAREISVANPEWGLMGFNILACIIGMLFMIADCSLIYGVEKMYYILGAMAVAYVRERASRQRGHPIRAPGGVG